LLNHPLFRCKLFSLPRDTPAEQPHSGSAGASHSFAQPEASNRPWVQCRRIFVALAISLTILAANNEKTFAQAPPALPPSEGATPQGAAILGAIESSIVEAIQACEKSVVAISRVRNDQVARLQVDPQRFGASLQLTEDPTSEDFVPSFFGSGVIISHDGYIVTCSHVLDDPKRHRYYVWLDHRCYSAGVVGKLAAPLASDPFSDLAILKIEADDLNPIRFSNQPVKKGQFVLALGNPYAIARDGEASASWGIVSNTKRYAPKEVDESTTENVHQLGTLIHTDLRIPVGSSGGAIVNLKGEFVGLTTTLLANRGFEQSAGFAIAADDFFMQVIESLKQGKQPEYGFLGVQPENIESFDRDRGLDGARVRMVIPGLPGNLAGLREGDVISQVDGTKIRNRNDLFRELSKVPSGKTTKLVVQRLRPAGPPQELAIEAELTKKLLATNRPSFSIHGPPTWRGAQVEYQSAIAGELERISIVRGPQIAFLSVTPDSPCWRAGIRAGFGIISVNGQPVETPAKFHELVSQSKGEIALVVMATNGREIRITVAEDANAEPRKISESVPSK
jgi:serine protease Do